ALAALLRAGGRRLVFGGVLCGVLTGLLVRGQVLDEGPQDRALAHYHEGIAYDRLGDQGKALSHFTRAFEVASGHPDVRNNYARALFASGRRDEGQAVLQEGIAADPSAILLRVSLGWMQLQQGRAAEAERQLR